MRVVGVRGWLRYRVSSDIFIYSSFPLRRSRLKLKEPPTNDSFRYYKTDSSAPEKLATARRQAQATKQGRSLRSESAVTLG